MNKWCTFCMGEPRRTDGEQNTLASESLARTGPTTVCKPFGEHTFPVSFTFDPANVQLCSLFPVSYHSTHTVTGNERRRQRIRTRVNPTKLADLYFTNVRFFYARFVSYPSTMLFVSERAR